MKTIIAPRGANTIGSFDGTQISTTAVPTPLLRGCPIANISARLRPIGPARVGKMQGAWVVSTSAAASNPADFQTGDTAFDNLEIDVIHLVKRGHISAPESGNGLSTSGHSEQSLIHDFDKEVFALAMLAYSGVTLDLETAAADFDTGDLETLAKSFSSPPRTALIAGDALPGVAGDLIRDGGRWVYPGVDGGVFEADLTGSDADVAVVAGPDSLAHLVERPETTAPPGEVRVSEIVLPVTGLTVWKFTWNDRKSRAKWASIEALIGFTPANTASAAFAATPEE